MSNDLKQLMLLQQKIAPELIETLQRRYNILRTIHFLQPIGRRGLADRMGMGERIIRGEVDFFKGQGLVETQPDGMRVTLAGEELLTGLERFDAYLLGLGALEQELEKRLGLEKAIIIPGDSDQDELIKMAMGRAVGNYLNSVLNDGSILAVTGGTTLAKVVSALPDGLQRRNVLVVPARGGLGEEVELQANTIAARLAVKLGASYRLLHAPDNLGEEAMALLSRDPKIKELVDLVKGAHILLHGIGVAREMARRRGVDAAEMKKIMEEGAVGEAFGYYFDANGRIVHTTGSIGIHLEDLGNIKKTIAVAGGTSKAKAILAVLSSGYQHVLVTDSAAAEKMV